MKARITSLRLENHSLQVPEGLSELLAANENWGERKASTHGYKREVVKRDGRLFTILTEAGETR